MRARAFVVMALAAFAAPLLARTISQGPTATVDVCVGAGNVLRAVDAGQACAAGQQRLSLDGRSTRPDGSTPPTEKRPPGDVNRALAALEARMRDLERSATFEVVDRAGQVIFSVGQGVVRLFDRNDAPVAEILAFDGGGVFTARSTNGVLAASIDASAPTALVGFRVLEGGLPRLDAGRQPFGNYSMRMVSPDGDAVAAIGESRAGTGALVVGDRLRGGMAQMLIADGKGLLQVLSVGTPVSAMTEGATQGGLLAINDGVGEPMVKMGVNQDRYGIVVTGPAAGLPLVPATGLPGSYIIGRSGG